MKRGKTDIAVAEVAVVVVGAVVVVVEEQLDSYSHQDSIIVDLEGSWGAGELVPHENQGSWAVGS